MLPLLASGATRREVVRVLSISEEEASLRRQRLLSATHSRSLFEALTKLRRDRRVEF